MLNICMSSKSTQAYSWRKYPLGVIRGTDPSASSGSPPGTLHRMGRVAREALAHLPKFMLFPGCLKQVSYPCSQVIDPAGHFTSLYYGWSLNLLSAPHVIELLLST